MIPSHDWKVSRDIAPDFSGARVCIRDGAGWSVAYLTGADGPELEQRARLIAAAPAMLQALAGLAEYVRRDMENNAPHWRAVDVAEYRAALAALKRVQP